MPSGVAACADRLGPHSSAPCGSVFTIKSGSHFQIGPNTGIIERASQDGARWLDDLVAMDTPEARQKAKGDSVEEWVTASLLAARDAYQDPATGQRMKSGAKLGDAYYERSLPVAKRRLLEAGVRLAWVLNEGLASD